MADSDTQSQLTCDDLDFSARGRFAEVLAAEYVEVEQRRKNAGQTGQPSVNGRPRKMTGLALSGGGVRSATFNLGVLQALAANAKLASFDFLSTVSGGGYTGGWWSAWLARPERDNEPGAIFPPNETIVDERDAIRAAMEAEEYRGGTDRQQVKDSAITAATDPIHHLRLFSNFLTPRKGILSADTWRAITTTLRNVLLTQIILLPILLGAIMIGQALFVLAGDPDSLVKRLLYALAIPLLLLAGTFTASSVWIVATRRLTTAGDKAAVLAGGIVFVALTALALTVLNVSDVVILALVVLVLLWIVYIFVRLFWWQFVSKTEYTDDAYWRNRLVLIQTKTLAYAAFTCVILLFAGFGHIVFDFLLTTGTTSAMKGAAKAGGWGAFVMSILSAIYTAYKASPTGGADAKAKEEPGLLQRVAFKIAPGLFLLTAGILLAWIGDKLFRLVETDPVRVLSVARGALVAAFLFLIFALYEFRPRQRWKTLIPISAIWIALVAAAVWHHFRPGRTIGTAKQLFWLSVITLALLSLLLFYRAILRRKRWIAGYALVLAVAAIWFYTLGPDVRVLFDEYLPRVVVAGVIGTLFLLLLEVIAGRGANTRCIALAVIGCTIFVGIGAAASAGSRDALTIIALLGIIFGWVLSLGWLADPNALTFHAFYKSRLVRAYLGASNAIRGEVRDADITDAVPGDDVLLTQLKNTERGAPYHLVNTMLNLVGGHDLATQARASELFLMSKHYCGSVRTGFRKTKDYSCGSITLGTAVAVSGAAAAPSMGAQTPSAALSALMTLFNVRLGYWAPTPNLSYWRSGSTRLWPVYTLQELISQTTDLLPYCYLTDGGHYENTGIYPLIERGCNLIVVGECGADPDTTLDDLGNMIRKVRIDFGAEVDLDIDNLRKKPPTERVIVGTIRYGEKHAKSLGLPDDEREGTLIVIKPNRAPGDVPVDVQQYGFLNDDFPQQQTFDLFYDEAQFESYRRLGFLSATIAAAKMDEVTAPKAPASAATPPPSPSDSPAPQSPSPPTA